jgi:hypothetical protein
MSIVATVHESRTSDPFIFVCVCYVIEGARAQDWWVLAGRGYND